MKEFKKAEILAQSIPVGTFVAGCSKNQGLHRVLSRGQCGWGNEPRWDCSSCQTAK